MKRLDLTGKVFGKWKVLSYSFTKSYHDYWHCICECGNEKDVRDYNLISGKSKSCGCQCKDLPQKFQKTHGKTNTRLYKIWCAMKHRCENPASEKSKKNYKDRGITICKEWHDFINFQKWALENGYADNLSIDRIDNNGNYCPENCKWSTAKEQAQNRRSNVFVTYNNKTQTISQWADELNIKRKTLTERLRKGWSVERAFTYPVNKGVI